jgi:hypothetical protein
MLRIPHCLDNRLTDGGKVVSLTHRPRSLEDCTAPLRGLYSENATFFTSGQSSFIESWVHLNSPGIIKKLTRWPESMGTLYRPSDSRLSAKLVSTFADRVCHVVSVTDPHGRILGFLDWSRYFFFFK